MRDFFMSLNQNIQQKFIEVKFNCWATNPIVYTRCCQRCAMKKRVVPLRTTQPGFSMNFKMCPGSDLNRYDRCGSQDFKSCVSTSSTTRVNKLICQFHYVIKQLFNHFVKNNKIILTTHFYCCKSRYYFRTCLPVPPGKQLLSFSSFTNELK